MSNVEITNCDLGGVAIGQSIFRDETLTFAAADVFAPGTILARRSVALAVTASAFTGGGDGTISAASVVDGPVVPMVGAYVLRCTSAVANGGVFRLEDPNGAIVATGLTLTPGSGGSTIFEVGGLRFTVTDGGADFVAGATATLTVAADGKLVPYAPGGAGGAQIPCAVLTYEVSKDGAGDVGVRVLVSGEVNATRLVIDGGGSITNALLDQLRAVGIVGTRVSQHAVLDNQ